MVMRKYDARALSCKGLRGRADGCVLCAREWYHSQVFASYFFVVILLKTPIEAAW
jgi:hypothetical protein